MRALDITNKTIYIGNEHFTGAILRQIEAPKSAIFHFPVKCSVADNGVKVGNMKKIPLSQGKFALVDDEDYEWLNEKNWCASNPSSRPNCWYAVYAIWDKEKKKGRMESMHRLIMEPPKGFEIDHINHNGLDNRRYNLRICTPSGNRRNQRKTRGTSRYKGVHWYKAYSKWRTKINVTGEEHHIGYYDNEEDAARAYDRAALKYHGEFACTNERLGLYAKGN